MTAKNAADLTTEATTNLADNTTGDISASDVRTMVTDLIDSLANTVDLKAGTALQLGTVSVATGQLKLANSSSASLTTIQAGNAAAARTYTWPTNFGSSGAVLTDAAGNGTLSWAVPAAGVTEPFTFTRLVTITQGTANEGVLASTGYSLTGSDATSMVDLAGTWNTSGNPVALKIALTNTASGATSKFVSLLAGAAGATEIFAIKKTGDISVGVSGVENTWTFLQAGGTFTFSFPSTNVTMAGAGAFTLSGFTSAQVLGANFSNTVSNLGSGIVVRADTPGHVGGAFISDASSNFVLRAAYGHPDDLRRPCSHGLQHDRSQAVHL